MKHDNATMEALMTANGIDLNNTQDLAAIKNLLFLLIKYQEAMGIPDVKLRKFLSVAVDFIEICQTEETKKK